MKAKLAGIYNIPIRVYLLSERKFDQFYRSRRRRYRIHGSCVIAAQRRTGSKWPYVVVNGRYWRNLNKTERIALVEHEILHILLGHSYRKLNVPAMHREVNRMMTKQNMRILDWVCDG